ncbi:PH domain-containing protein [Oscillospiraceae bacterium WX1]
MRVKSAVDTWYKVIIFAVIAILIAAIVLKAIVQPSDILGLVIDGTAFILLGGLLLWMLCGTYYELRADDLYCRSGPFFEKIRYDKIKYLGLTENFLSSMALSSERIEIRQHGRGYITGTTMISPENREDFLEKLKARCHHLDPNEK